MRFHLLHLLALSTTVFLFSPVIPNKAYGQVRVNPATATYENQSAKSLISKIFVDGQSFSIVAFDEHASGDRSWGLARLQKNATGFETTYTQDFATYRILLHYLPDNTLQVTTIAMYKDDAGINVNKYHFIRTDERGSSSSKK